MWNPWKKWKKKRYDNVKITNVVDGTTIEGHEAVEAYFEHERKLVEAYGDSITFQLFRIDVTAKTLDKLQGEKLAELRIDAGAVSGTDTVAKVKESLRPSWKDYAKESDRITLIFSGRPMQDEALFYADHFMVLPVWVQVLLHDCEFAEVKDAIRRLA